MTSLYDKLPADTRDAILTEAAPFSTMLEGDDANAARLMEETGETPRRSADARRIEIKNRK